MKVLHVIDALGLGGGAEHSLAALLPRLRAAGVDSTVATLIPRGFGIETALREDGFRVEVLGGAPRSGSRIPAPVAHLRRVRALRRLIRSERPDLVHATLVNASFVSRLATIGTGAPLLNSLVNTTYDPARVRSLGLSPRKLAVLRAVDSFTLRHRVDHVHALTAAVSGEAVEVLGFPAERTTVIPRGRDGDALGRRSVERRAKARAGLGIVDDVTLVLNIGRQDDQKGQVELIEAVASLGADRSDLVVAIAGRKGSASPRIEEAIERLGMGDRILLLGHRDDIADLLSAADIFAFPSLYEGLGCALIEAMALEAPMIGSDAPAIEEVLEGGDLGLVVARGDRGALAAAIAELADDPERRDELAAAGRARFEAVYELDRVAEATLDLYRRISGLGADGSGRGAARRRRG